MAQNITSAPYKGTGRWEVGQEGVGGGYIWDYFHANGLMAKRSSGNSYGCLGVVTHMYHLNRAPQAVSLSFESLTGPGKSCLEKQAWPSITFLSQCMDSA